MKRQSRSADVDQRGRVRRVQTAPPQILKVTLMGSLAGAGIDLDVPVGRFMNETVEYAGCVWTWGGKKTETGRRIYCKRPTERPIRRFIMWLIGKNGKDPRLEPKPQPYVMPNGRGRGPGTRRGAIRRAATRANRV
jgi:hypothetical protein